MIRKATPADIPAVSLLYEKIHDAEEAGLLTIGWERQTYPTEKTAQAALEADELYVLEENGAILASARINTEQMPAYEFAAWEYDAAPEKVLVMHTLCVLPSEAGRGLGSSFVRFYEELARKSGRPYLRIDTNERNANARRLYKKLGYKEIGVIPCEFCGIAGVNLVCIEKKL